MFRLLIVDFVEYSIKSFKKNKKNKIKYNEKNNVDNSKPITKVLNCQQVERRTNKAPNQSSKSIKVKTKAPTISAKKQAHALIVLDDSVNPTENLAENKATTLDIAFEVQSVVSVPYKRPKIRPKKLVKPAIMCDSKSTRCQQKMYGKSPFQDRTMPHDWLNYLPFVETDQEENVNSNVSMQLDYNPTRENPVETLPLTKMSPRTSSNNNTNVIPDEVLHTPIASLGADSSNVCMEDQLKAYRLKSFKEQSKPYCGRVNKTRFQTEYNQEFFREGNAYRHTNDWLHHLNLVRRLTQ